MLLRNKILATSLLSIALISTASAFTCPEASQIEYNDNYGWVLNNAPEWDIMYHPYGPVADQAKFVEASFQQESPDVNPMLVNHAVCGYAIAGSHFELIHTRPSAAPSTEKNWRLIDDDTLICTSDNVYTCELP